VLLFSRAFFRNAGGHSNRRADLAGWDEVR
jgi:hypothetical protein